MNTLHLLNESPFIGNSLTNALVFAGIDDALLLTGDAIYALQKDTTPYQLLAKTNLPIWVLKEDLAARNVQSSLDNVKIINYSEFVELCTLYKKVISWL